MFVITLIVFYLVLCFYIFLFIIVLLTNYTFMFTRLFLLNHYILSWLV